MADRQNAAAHAVERPLPASEAAGGRLRAARGHKKKQATGKIKAAQRDFQTWKPAVRLKKKEELTDNLTKDRRRGRAWPLTGTVFGSSLSMAPRWDFRENCSPTPTNKTIPPFSVGPRRSVY